MAADKFHHKKSLGQHFLTSDVVPVWMCDAAKLHPEDVVLEVGPGTGALTKVLLQYGVTVIALETDERALAILEDEFADAIASGQLTLINCDVRELELSTIPQLTKQPYKVVANIPYYLSGFLFRTFLETSTQPSDIVFLVQKEVARRAAARFARGEKHSLLSLSTQVYGEVSYIKTVSRGHFTPPPNVDSAVVAIHSISRDHFKNIDEALYFELLHLGFAQKRKQLLGNLAAVYSRETLIEIFTQVDIPLNARAEDIPLEKWLTLTAAMAKVPH